MCVRSPSSPSRLEMICLGQRLLIGTTAGDGRGEADAVRNMWDVHTCMVSSTEPRLNAIRDFAESVCGITDYNIGRAFYTTRHYRQAPLGHIGRRRVAPGFDSPGSDT